MVLNSEDSRDKSAISGARKDSLIKGELLPSHCRLSSPDPVDSLSIRRIAAIHVLPRSRTHSKVENKEATLYLPKLVTA